MKKFQLFIVFGLLLSVNSYAICQFDKDLIKLSKLKGGNIFYDDKDALETSKTLFFLSSLKSFQFIDLSDL
jgi:hypothetical protein